MMDVYSRENQLQMGDLRLPRFIAGGYVDIETIVGVCCFIFVVISGTSIKQ